MMVRSTSALLHLAIGLMLLPAWLQVVAAEEPSIYWQYETEGFAGVAIWEVSNPEGLQLRGIIHRDTGDLYLTSEGYFLDFVSAEGSDLAMLKGAFAGPRALGEKNFGARGFLYAGASDVNYVMPASQEQLVRDSDWMYPHPLGATHGWMVLAWASNERALDLRIHANWTTGTTITLVHESEDAWIGDLTDFSGGYRAGAPAAVRAQGGGDQLRFETDRMAAWVSWLRTGDGGIGSLQVETGIGHSWDIDLTVQNPYGGENPWSICICSENGALSVTTPGFIELEVEYVGSGRDMDVGVVVARIPGFLPDFCQTYENGWWETSNITEMATFVHRCDG